MDSNPIDEALYNPQLIDPTTDQQSPLQIVDTSGGGQQPHSQQSSGGGGTNPLTDIGNILGGVSGDALSLIPGFQAVVALVGVVKSLVGDIDSAVKQVEGDHPLQHIAAVLTHIPDPKTFFTIDSGKLWTWITRYSIGPVFDSMLKEGLGVDTDKFTSDEKGAVGTIDTMLGWAAGMMFIVTAIDSAGKSLFANRWPEAISNTLSRFPEEIGVSWALGLTIDEAFKSAQGVILTEAINKQKRPNRIEWPQIRYMLKQAVIDHPTYKKLLEAQGFPDEQIDWLYKLADTHIPVGDIGQLYLRDMIDEKRANELVKALGFDDEAAGFLTELYVTKSENEASVTYRTIAKQLFTNNLITEDQYRSILEANNFPKKLIKQDIAGVNLEHSAGRLLHAVGEIKTRYQHNMISAGEAESELKQLNYAPSFASELVQSWNAAPLIKQKQIGAAKVLSYLISGIMDKGEAQNRLIALGYKPDDASFLVDHPSANAGARVHAATPALVIQAYVDGAIQPSALADALTKVGLKGDVLTYYEKVAQYRLAHKKGSPHANVPLTEGDYKSAYKVGLIDFQTLVSSLEQIGYSPDNALLIAEIENKGPYQKPTAPAFSSVGAAAAFMEGLGYKIIPPPDPNLQAAESMLAMAGYSWVAPITPPPNPYPPAGANP